MSIISTIASFFNNNPINHISTDVAGGAWFSIVIWGILLASFLKFLNSVIKDTEQIDHFKPINKFIQQKQREEQQKREEKKQ